MREFKFTARLDDDDSMTCDMHTEGLCVIEVLAILETVKERLFNDSSLNTIENMGGKLTNENH